MKDVKLNDKAYIEYRSTQYKEDKFIKYCAERIKETLDLSTPTIMIELGGFTKAEIDDNSKRIIKYWYEIAREYIKINYSDIINKIDQP